MTLVGLADHSSPRPYNRELSEPNGELRRDLAGKGVNPNLIDVEGEGETPSHVQLATIEAILPTVAFAPNLRRWVRE